MEITGVYMRAKESEWHDRKLIEEVARLFNKLLMMQTLEEIPTKIKICERSKPKIRIKE